MSEHERKVADEEVQSEINEFVQGMTEQQIDAEAGEAELWDMFVDGPGDEDGLVMIFETTTGNRFTKWMEQPDPGEQLADLNMILRYMEVDRREPQTWLGETIPIEYDRHTDEWEINWREIERILAERSDRALEEGKADAE